MMPIKTLLIVLLVFLPAFSHALETLPVRSLLPGNDSPGGEAPPLPRYQRKQHKGKPSWAIRTGAKKGIKEFHLSEEVSAGPDVAVLRGGFFEQWLGLLADFQEPAFPADPRSIAGMENTKPLLIIPSGALYGLAHSTFFQAALADYARSGGIIICFAQQQGEDFSALPVPPSQSIHAVGWSKDFGPLFRASTIRSRHPILSGMKRTAPEIETEGYLASYPEQTKILLSRRDGKPTLILYPFGAGWVVVTTLFSDVSHGQGHLHRDEKKLVRDLLSWAKARSRVKRASPGKPVDLRLSMVIPRGKRPSRVRIMVMRPDRRRPIVKKVMKLAAAGKRDVPFRFMVPKKIQPGIYRLDYVLLDKAGKAIAPPAESASGWFSIARKTLLKDQGRSWQSFGRIQQKIRVTSSVERTNKKITVTLSIASETGTPNDLKLVARLGGKEKSFRLAKSKTSLSFRLSTIKAGASVPYAVYHGSGRLLARGTIAISHQRAKGIVLDRVGYYPGQKATISTIGLKSGELTLIGLGQIEDRMIAKDGSTHLVIPPDLPAGTYTLAWTLQHKDESIQRGEVAVTIVGNKTKFLGLSLRENSNDSTYRAEALFRLYSDRAFEGTMKLWVRRPDGSVSLLQGKRVRVSRGRQEIGLPVSFKKSQSGMGELIYGLYVTLPEGAGIPSGPVSIASGRKIIDLGDAAILGIRTDRPVYYEPTGPVALSASVYGRGKARIDLYVDGKRIHRERILLSGVHHVSATIPSPARGFQMIRVVVAPKSAKTSAGHSFTYGTDFPDLAAGLEVPALDSSVLPVSVSVVNRGKKASGKSRIILYDGDPHDNGKRVGASDVPPLEPGAKSSATIDWPLSKKAGPRKLHVVADPDERVTETDRRNNTAALPVMVPDFLVTVKPEKERFSAGEKIPFRMVTVNLTKDTVKSLSLNLRLLSPGNTQLSRESLVIKKLKPGREMNVQRSFRFPTLPQGDYHIAAQLVSTKPLASASTGITILPTLLLRGSLSGTPAALPSCGPFVLRYRVTNRGNIPTTSGEVSVTIKSPDQGRPIYAKQFGFSEGPKTVHLGKHRVPTGRYTLRLKAQAKNRTHNMSKDFLLAEMPLLVSPPVTIKEVTTAIPRVLILKSPADTGVNRILEKKILDEAFEGQGVYYKVVSSARDFRKQAMTGMFTSSVLFEHDEVSGTIDWLEGRVRQGHGLVIIGNSDQSRAAAESFGFRFARPLLDQGMVLKIPKDSGMDLSGTIPVSGTIVPPEKKGARPLAVIAKNNRPVALIDTYGTGKVIVLPFSVVTSTLQAGTVNVHSRLLRSIIHAVTPERDKNSAIAGAAFSVTSPVGKTRTRIIDILPAGTTILWAGKDGVVRDSTVTYTLTAGQDPQKRVYIYRPVKKAGTKPVRERYYECNGKFIKMRGAEMKTK